MLLMMVMVVCSFCIWYRIVDLSRFLYILILNQLEKISCTNNICSQTINFPNYQALQFFFFLMKKLCAIFFFTKTQVDCDMAIMPTLPHNC
jgi:hypothetical protein